MDLRFDPAIAQRYKSASQRARVLTESWAEGNLYCPACLDAHLRRRLDNTKIYDFICPRCAESFQLKSQQHPIGAKILDSAYHPMLQAVRRNLAPNFFLLHYDPVRLFVQNLLLIPRYFISTSCIEARKPLSETARRAGWIGCLINLSRVPEQGRIFLVREEAVQPTREVGSQYRRFRFLNKTDWRSRGWTADVLACLDKLGKTRFTLDEVYAFESELKALHPGNFHIRDKIRQQLQILRDQQIVRFVDRGVYRLG